ncbi:hypothetical protein D3C76_1542230 [compost metagenome]
MHHLAAGNGSQRLPHFTLEGGASRGGRQSVDNAEIALEPGGQLIAKPARIAGADALVALRPVVDIQQFHHPVAVLLPLHGAQVKLLVRNHPQRPQRGSNFIFE